MDNLTTLNKVSIALIEEFLEKKLVNVENTYSIKLKNVKSKTFISLEIILESDTDVIISVYTENSHLQLQSCKGFLLSKMLEEIIFISETGGKISGLIISKQGDCSLYSNVEKSLLTKDFMELSSEKLLAAVALSITESFEK